MNKSAIKLLTVMIAVTIMLAGCFAKNKKTTEMENTNATELSMQTEAPTYETIPIPDVTLPEGEGFEFDFEDPTVETQEVKEPVETTKPTKPQETTKPTETTPNDKVEEPKPTEGTTKPTEEPKPTEPAVSDGPCCEYAKYLAMSPADQEAYMHSFSNPMSFIEWCKNAEAQHNAHDDTIMVEGGNLDIGDYMN